MSESDVIRFKQQAAERAVAFVSSGMTLGLGTGSTVRFALEAIARRLHQGDLERIEGVPTSIQTEHRARELGIPLITLNDRPMLDLTIDGADEVDDDLNLIKGGGGALLREKIVAQASSRNIIIVDHSKCSSRLGTHWPVPVEVHATAWKGETDFLASIGGRISMRMAPSGVPQKTDNGNVILDADFGPIANPHDLNHQLNNRAGIMAHGLFLWLAADVIVAGKDGIRHLTKNV